MAQIEKAQRSPTEGPGGKRGGEKKWKDHRDWGKNYEKGDTCKRLLTGLHTEVCEGKTKRKQVDSLETEKTSQSERATY